jgi:GxxExxY protein
MEHEELTERIIGCAMTVHKTLGPGFLESVYQRSLTHELHKCGLLVVCEQRLVVKYDGVVAGEFIADMVVEGLIMVKNKAVQGLHPIHEVQLVNYLTATGVDIGLLLNFGADRLQVKRKHRTYRPKNQPEGAQP